jgi:hypothetical protein
MDSLLIYADRYEGKVFSVFDLHNKRFVGRFVSEGQGPNEVIPGLYLLKFPQKDKLYTYQRNAAIISIFNVPDYKIKENFRITSSTPWRPFEMEKTKDYYIGMGIFDKGRFGVYDSKGKFLYTGGHYPYKGDDMESSKAFLMYQGPFCANPDKNYFVASCLYSDHIVFYEITKNALIPIKEYYSYDVTVDGKNSSAGNSSVREKDETVFSYQWAFGTGSCCYMLFSGKTYAEDKERSGESRYIIVFDWQGNYIKTFHTDYDIKSFCVDEKNNYIYASALDEDFEYIIIKLKI